VNAVEIRQRLRDEQAKVAHDALSSPVGRDAYAYGRACGVYSGLGMAIALFDEILEEHVRVRSDL
jgi:hypothetical protein